MNDPRQSAIEVAGGGENFNKFVTCIRMYGEKVKLTEEVIFLDSAIDELINDIRSAKKLSYEICLGNVYFFKSFLYSLPRKNKTNWLTTEFDVRRFASRDCKWSVERILVALM